MDNVRNILSNKNIRTRQASSQMLNVDGRICVTCLLRFLFYSEFLILWFRASHKIGKECICVRGACPKEPAGWQSKSLLVSSVAQVSQSKVIWTIELVIILSCFLSLALFALFVYLLYILSSLISGSLFSLLQQMKSSSKAESLSFASCVSGHHGADIPQPTIWLVSLWHQIMDCEICQQHWRSPGSVISSFRCEIEAPKWDVTCSVSPS